MLRLLHIRDLVLVRELELTLGNGMSALTGETGAGKSILIDALGLALGGRSDQELIRHGADRAEVCAAFDVSTCPEAAHWLVEQALDADGDCLLRRVLPRNGRSRAFINGSPVPLAQLAELGRLLVDIHGQHAHQSLLRASAQRALLDAYANHPALLDATAAAFRALCRAREQRDELAAADDSRLEFVAFQLAELDAIDLSDSRLGYLEGEQRRLAHAEALQQRCGQLAEWLCDGNPDVHQLLTRAVAELGDLSDIDPALAEIGALLGEAEVQVAEAAGRLRAYLADLESDPTELEVIETALSQWHDLARKHRVAVTALQRTRDALRAEHAALIERDARLETLDTEISRLSADYRTAAERLSESRVRAADRLAREVSGRMQELGMRGGRFGVVIQPVMSADTDIVEAAAGCDRVEFQVAANPGQPLSPLAATASGGELSRISLAIQVTRSAADGASGATPTLIFDEVDSGIGGAVAEIVGQLMRRLGTQQQVLCVTHLPQVASQAHHHYRVSKTTADGRAETSVDDLDDEKRVQEIARMLGGVDISKRTLAHADEMIKRSRTQSCS